MRTPRHWDKAFIFSVLAITLIAALAGWWSGSGQLAFKGSTYGICRSLANLFAFLAACGILLQLILIARVPWLDRTFGMDKLARLHHVLGFAIPAAIVAHPLLLVAGEAAVSGGTWFGRFQAFVSGYEDVPKAVASAVLFLALVAMSLVIVLGRLKYETWYYAHLVMYLATLLFIGHQFESGDDMYGWYAAFWSVLYAVTFGFLVVFRFAMPIYRFWRHGFTVDSVVSEGGGCWSVYLKGRDLSRLPVRAGQFFIVRFLDKRRWWQAHPFSLSCAPNAAHLRFTFKELGDFTKELSGLKPGTKVLLDGPHGAFTERAARSDKFVLIAGGIGITPIRALAESLAKQGKKVVMLFGTKTCTDMTFKGELDKLAAACPNLAVHCVVSRDETWTGERGFIDAEKIQRLAPDFKTSDFYVCGPKPMTDAVIKALVSIGADKTRIHYERFSL